MESRLAIIAPQTCPGFTNQRALYTYCRSRLSFNILPQNLMREGDKTLNLLLRDANLDRGICEMRKMLKVVAISQLLEIRSLIKLGFTEGRVYVPVGLHLGRSDEAVDKFYLEIH